MEVGRRRLLMVKRLIFLVAVVMLPLVFSLVSSFEKSRLVFL
jgi:ABC-type sugar transport system permease subunit